MKNRSSVIAVLVIIVLFIFVNLSVGKQEPRKITVEETVDLLLKYIYDVDYFPLCKEFHSIEEGPLLTVYADIGFPAYEFELPDNNNHPTVQVFCDGETENGDYLGLGVYIWTPVGLHADEEEREYDRAELYSYFLVNRFTKEIVRQRDTDDDGYWIYDTKYSDIVQDSFIKKDSYE